MCLMQWMCLMHKINIAFLTSPEFTAITGHCTLGLISCSCVRPLGETRLSAPRPGERLSGEKRSICDLSQGLLIPIVSYLFFIPICSHLQVSPQLAAALRWGTNGGSGGGGLSSSPPSIESPLIRSHLRRCFPPVLSKVRIL